VTPAGFTESLGAHPTDLLDELVAAGLVRHIEARDMYGLLPAGKERHVELLADIAPPDVAAGLQAPYERFLELNDRFKRLCTDWQLRDGEPNDHSDAAHDQRCTDALAGLAEEARALIVEMSAVEPRLSRYGRRLDAAAECVRAGETRRFTGVMCESFHDVWMELHEDLILLQQIDRVAEGSF
jgi:hypothetical protein